MNTVIVIFIGLVFGSFSTALAWRGARDISVVGNKKKAARSACPICGHALGILDLVPIFSWLLLRGKCRYCKGRIGWIYPALELACLAGCLGIYAGWGLTLPGVLLMFSVPFLLALAVIDFQTYLLPNRFVLALAGIGVGYLLASPWTADTLPPILLHRAGAALAYAGLIFVTGWVLTKLLKKDALGFGDVKFFAVAGLYLGLSVLPFYLMISGVCGLILGLFWRFLKKGAVFPFGPAIILALYACLLLQQFGVFPY